MIEQKFTRQFRSEHRPVKTGVIIEDEGIALVFERSGSDTVVCPSTGVSGEVFAGISLSRNTPPTFDCLVLEFKVPASKTIQLPRFPLAGQILVKNGTSALTIGASAPGDATAVQLEGDEITFHSSVAVDTVIAVTMQFELTASEARQRKGDAPWGGLSSTGQGVIGMITQGDVSTSYFNAGDDWSSALEVKLGANGMFTTSGSGVTVPNAVVVAAPSAANPQLVISLR